MTTTTTHTNNQHPVAPDHPTRIFAQWGLPHTVTPRFGARLIQSRYRLDFLSDRASLIGEWSEVQIANLDQAFPELIKALEATRFNRTQAAKLLGLTFRSMRYRMERLGIK